MLGTLTYLTDLFFIDEDYAPSYDDANILNNNRSFEDYYVARPILNGKKPLLHHRFS